MRVNKTPILLVTIFIIIMFIGTQPASTALATSAGPKFPLTSASGSDFIGSLNSTIAALLPTTLTVTPIDDYYGEYTDFTATLSPAVSGKTISYTLNGAPACSADTDDAGIATCQAPLLDDVGTYPGGVGATFAGDEEYSGSTGFADVNIRQKPASVTPDPATKIYGDADPAFSGTLTGFIILDEITANYSRTAGETVAGSPYIISATLVDPYNKLGNYNITYNTAEFTITPKAASVSAVANSKTYGSSDPTLSTTNSGFVAADLGAGKITFSASRAAGESVAGSPYLITPAASDNGSDLLDNYTVTLNPANFTINPKAASVSAVANSKTYGDADPTLSTTNSGFLAADLGAGKITFSASRAVGESVAGSPYLITPAASDNGSDLLDNYTVTLNPANFTINPKAASVSAVANSKTYGDADPALSTTNSGFLAADLGAGKITFSASRAAGETVIGGPYLITPAASDNGSDLLNNYTVAINTADFTIMPKAASVTPNSASKRLGQTDPPLAGTLTGFLPADNVTAIYSRTPGETIAGSPYTISAVLSPAGVLSNYTITYNTAYFYITEFSVFLPLVVH